MDERQKIFLCEAFGCKSCSVSLIKLSEEDLRINGVIVPHASNEVVVETTEDHHFPPTNECNFLEKVSFIFIKFSIFPVYSHLQRIRNEHNYSL